MMRKSIRIFTARKAHISPATSEAIRPKFGWKASDAGRFWFGRNSIKIICFVVGIVTSVVLSGVKQQASAQWNEPVELTNTPGQSLDSDFSVGIDSHGTLHISYTLNNFEGRREGNRVMYERFDSSGISLGEATQVLGAFRTQGEPKLIVDGDNEVHILCPASEEMGDQDSYYYCKFNADGEWLAAPTLVLDTRCDSVGWHNSEESFFFRKSDGSFILTGLPYIYRPSQGDTMLHTAMAFINFDSTGTSLLEPQILSEESENYFYNNNAAALDLEDNLYIGCRRHGLNVRSEVVYLSVSADNQLTNGPMVLPGSLHPERDNTVNDIVATDPSHVFLFRNDLRAAGELQEDYMQCISSNGEVRWFTSVFQVQANDGSIYLGQNIWRNQILFSGSLRPNHEVPRDVWQFMSSMDTDGQMLDSLDMIYQIPKSVNTSTLKRILRNESAIYGFYIGNRNREEDIADCHIFMVKKSLYDLSVDNQSNNRPQWEESSLTIYPNPFNSSFTVAPNFGRTPVAIDLLDLTGRLVSVPVSTRLPSGRFAFNASDLPAGAYFVRLQTPEGSYLRKVNCLK